MSVVEQQKEVEYFLAFMVAAYVNSCVECFPTVALWYQNSSHNKNS